MTISTADKVTLKRTTRRSTAPRTLADGLLRAFAEAGITHCFGIPGRHVQGVYAAMPGAGLTPIVARHEQGAAFIADGFARVSGKPGLVVATAGPGASNLLTGFANAYADGVPLLALVGAAPQRFGGRGAFQALGDDWAPTTAAMFSPVCRHAAEISHPDQVGPAMRRVLQALPDGPAALSFPSDLLELPASERFALPPRRERPAPVPETLREAARWLNAFPNAVILAGRGALGASDAVTALAERLRIPVVTTVHGRGVIDEAHPLALGAQGFSANVKAEAYMATIKPDVVLAIGTSLREISTNVFAELWGGARALIHCTLDPTALGRHYPATVAAGCDARAFSEALLPLLQPRRAMTRNLRRTLGAFVTGETPATGEGVDPREVVAALRAALAPEDLLFVDTGNAVPWSVRHFEVNRPGTYFASLHLAAMGWGTAAAIGAQLAAPERRVAALVGDGCFQMTGMEVATAVQYGLPVVWVVLNDARFNMVYQGSENFYGTAVPNTSLSPIDAARVARGLGALGLKVTQAEDLPAALATAFESGRPTVVDVMIDPTAAPAMGSRAAALKRFEERRS